MLKFTLQYKSYLFVSGKEIFCLGSISNQFGATESTVVSLKGNVYGFSID